MIKSFGCADTEMVFNSETPKRFPPDIIRPAYRKLIALANAANIQDMAVPPANRLEKLHGDLAGWWSVRINKQYRIIFKWHDGMAEGVKIVDYH